MPIDQESRAFVTEISNDEVKTLFCKFLEVIDLMQFKTSLQRGVFAAIRIYSIENQYYFAAIINKTSLLFYVRKPFFKKYPHLYENLLREISLATSNSAGEVTVRIDSTEVLGALMHWIALHFGAALRGVTKNEYSNRGNAISENSKGTVMESLIVPASQVRQGSLTLYTTSIKVSDLIRPGFYSVETLDPDSDDDKGFQRLLNKARAKKLADYILRGQDDQDAFLPTSVFLATDKDVQFDPQSSRISIDLVKGDAFSVVDGQHRLEGLKMAAEKVRRVLDFEVPVNIAANLPKIAQMCHFLIVNTTQKSVDKSVEQRIMARLTAALDIEDIPNLPKWIRNTVERGEVERAIRYIDFLNEAQDSPWFGKIQRTNETSDGKFVNQRSFVQAIVKYVLTANNPIAALKDFDKEKKVFLNYWKALAEILDDGNSAVLYKYNGVELFCKFSIPFFLKLQDSGNFTVQRMLDILSDCFENVEGEYAGVGHPEWWASGGKASFLNSGAINVISQELARALHKSTMSSTIQL